VNNLVEKIKKLCTSPDEDARQRGEYAQGLLNQCKAELLSLPQELKDQKIAVKSPDTTMIFTVLGATHVEPKPKDEPKSAAPVQNAEDPKIESTVESNMDKQIEKSNSGNLLPRK
jgi:hypothetical protein